MKLNTAVYGLNDALRAWYKKVSEELQEAGAKCSLYDQALFYWHNGGLLQGVVGCHVDDFFYTGS